MGRHINPRLSRNSCVDGPTQTRGTLVLVNVCQTVLAEQATPKEFGPLFTSCKVTNDKTREAFDEMANCIAGAEEGFLPCLDDARKTSGVKLSRLGAGIHRVGVKFGGCVAKFALNDAGYQANQGEYEAWNQIGRHYKNVFAPVHDHSSDFSWITQPLLVPVTSLPSTQSDPGVVILMSIVLGDGSNVSLGASALDRVREWFREGYHVLQFRCATCGWTGTVQLGKLDYKELREQGRFQWECVRCGHLSAVTANTEITREMLNNRRTEL